ncbi:serine hydrolase [Marinimicrobium sp. ABcell2]|uniref:serine hydrolase n=1 Tax=Marinimicrobium sp. ABcell2 TaxID=3069751 RepID=UPI0027B1E7A8|nr:serine hydrolase [Marinimicrobium sp. ABcell2]MDQ2077012.1 serine hydrolase [Marinimicrobium sp. ABcell2]
MRLPRAVRSFTSHVLRPALLPLVLLAPLSALADLSGMAEEMQRIDDEMPGNLGVYIKRLSDGAEVNHRTDRDWYLASTTKIPLGIAVLQLEEDGVFDREHKLELQSSDFIDGSGQLLLAQPGSRYTIDELNKNSIQDSDSTATDMLIRFIGEDDFNKHVQARISSEGFGPITTIVAVRHDTYSEVHGSAKSLSNADIMDIRRASPHSARFETLLEKLGLSADDTELSSYGEAFEQYYKHGKNSGSLVAMGEVLERLIQGEYLNEENTERLLGYMKNVSTGRARLQAGLPGDAVLAHKTGTQVARACNVGILNAHKPEDAVIVATCAEQYGQIANAEKAFASIGAALTEAGLVVD